MDPRKPQLFIAHTPLHVIFAHAIATQVAADYESTLIIVGDFNDADLLVECIHEDTHSVFAQVYYLPGVYNRSWPHEVGSVRRENNQFLAEYLQQHKLARLVVFNDYCAESQAAYHFAIARNAQLQFIYGEDGGNAYSDYKVPYHSPEYCDSLRAYFGDWWEPVEVFGASERFHAGYATIPALVRTELRNKPVMPILRDAVLAVRDTRWASLLYSRMGLHAMDFRDADGIICLPHSDAMNSAPGFALLLQTCVRLATSEAKHFYLKLHPRESIDACQLPCCSSLPVLPKSIAMELLFLLGPAELFQSIIGGFTTAMLLIKWINPQANIIVIKHHDQPDDVLLSHTFQNIGIPLIDSVTAFARTASLQHEASNLALVDDILTTAVKSLMQCQQQRDAVNVTLLDERQWHSQQLLELEKRHLNLSQQMITERKQAKLPARIIAFLRRIIHHFMK